jgi:hypothetical protein
VDVDNASHVMVSFSNYGVQSLFHTTDGGTTWTAVGGNLEQFPDGSGNGPSVRCTKKLFFQGEKIIFAGTSCGLFSTRELKGDSTVWVKEGAMSIGNVIVDDIDARQTDGFIAIGTHGNGVYSTWFNPSAGIDETHGNQSFTVGDIFPNPVQDFALVEIGSKLSGNLKISLYSNSGKLVQTYPDKTIYPGHQTLSLPFGDLTAGIYYLMLNDGKSVVAKKIIKASPDRK